MKAYVFPGQASQFEGMGKDLYESSKIVKFFFEEANDILGYRISDTMFEGSMEDLSKTEITQPAVYLHSIAKVKLFADTFQPDMVAGHSLGEFSALAAAGSLSWQDGLQLVHKRALAMQKACALEPSAMAAILGLDDEIVENICKEIEEYVIPANYNCPGQLVISGSEKGVSQAVDRLKEMGAKRAIMLPVSGAFHSKYMLPAQNELAEAIESTKISNPTCPIFQNFTARGVEIAEEIKENLIKQLTAPVKWTQTMKEMIRMGATEFIEVGGTGKTLQGFVKKLDRSFPTAAL
jgi:[acyl-carrier-protein] S-malonyltransferase